MPLTYLTGKALQPKGTKSDDDVTVAAAVKDAIAKNKVIVFSKTYCPFCTKTKNLLSKEFPEQSIAVVELDEHKQGSEIQSELLSTTGQRTVPNVFVNGEHVGGNDDTTKAFKNGKLQKLIKL